MRLSTFINAHIDEIIQEWESFAQTLTPAADAMSALMLRDHAKEILQTIAVDIESWQNPEQQYEKSQGLAPEGNGKLSAASVHGALRQANDFSLLQLSAEFRALRASVLQLWLPKVSKMSPTTTYEMIRFNEAIDQALAESIFTYSARADHARDMFLAILGHDLRSPLSTMTLSGQMLTKPTLELAQAAQIGQRVQRCARLMTNMVDDLLGYSQAQLGGGMPIARGWVDIGEICRLAIEYAEAAHPQASFVLLTEGDLSGQFDSVRLHQLLANLLSNAAQYGVREHPVKLTARGEPDAVILAVANQGPAIPPDALKIIFAPLVQLSTGDDADVRPRTSMGLGLFVASEIASAHGGTIKVQSSDLDGTIFTVRLPRIASA